ncbi:hypothetical protein V6X62_01555 [Spiribacter sp. 218]|uniref:hypothetical protein n=1 Tax=Spiribacter pallidus TaxID=1987936 RepID=UPI00349F6602
MRFINLYLTITLLAFIAHATSIQAQDNIEPKIYGSMECKITGQQVLQSDEGKPAEYSSMGELKTGDTIPLRYGVEIEPSSEYALAFISLGTLLVQSSSIFNEHYGDADSFDLYEMSSGVVAAEGFLEFFNQTMHVRLERYYKSDWHGIATDYRENSLVRRMMTVDCRQDVNNWDAFRREANKAFDRYSN